MAKHAHETQLFAVLDWESKDPSFISNSVTQNADYLHLFKSQSRVCILHYLQWTLGEFQPKEWYDLIFVFKIEENFNIKLTPIPGRNINC